MKQNTIKALNYFVEKYNELKDFSFHDSAKNLQLKMSSLPNKNGQILYPVGPNKEQVAAFLLIFRMFIQNKDSISISNIEKTILIEPDISKEIKAEIQKLRNVLNSYLDDYPYEKVLPQGDFFPTRRDIMNTIIYGNQSHIEINKEEIKKYEKWLELPFNPGYIEFEFLKILKYIFKIIEDMAKIIKNEIVKTS